MEIPEHIGDFEEFLREHFRRYQAGMWTALPMVVNTWNYPSKQQNTVHAVPGVAGLKQNTDGDWVAEPMPECPDMPVHFMGGGDFFFTHPITQGDEGIGIFASRVIDGWWQNGGTNVARPSYGQNFMHEIGDGMFIPTRLSNKNILPSISQTSAQLRSRDGTSYIEMLGAGGGFSFVTPGHYMRFIGSSGNLHVSGNIYWNDNTAATDAAGHKHSSAAGDGGLQTGIVVPGT